MRKRIHARGVASLCLTLCLACAYLLTLPPARAGGAGGPVGDLSVSGRVLINGSEALSGAAVFPGSRFATEKNSAAEVTMGGLGRVRCLSESAVTLSFGDGAVAGSLEAGIIYVSKPEGVAARVVTRDGEVSAGKDGPAVFVVNVTGGNTVVRAKKGSVELRAGKVTKLVAEGQNAAAGTQQTPPRDDDDDDDDRGGWFWFGVAGYTAIVLGAIIWAVTNDDDGSTGPNPPIIIPPNPSPSR
jgi:archaeosine-15-forming tRNA-guanine transglycosylase